MADETLAQRRAFLIRRSKELERGTSKAQKAEFKKVESAIARIDRKVKRGQT